MIPPRIELLVHRVEIISENSFKARAIEEERRLLRFVRIHPSSRHGEGNEEKVKNKSDKATAVGSSFPRTQPLAFGLLSTFFRGLRTASSQERLTLLAKNTPSLSRQPLLPPPLSRSNSTPFLVLLLSSTVPQARRSHRRRNHRLVPFSRPLPPLSLSLSLSLLLGALERSKGDGIIDTEEKRDGER